jgi:hypothetical protein
VVDLIPTKASCAQRPEFGTLRGRIAIHDPDWWKPMSKKEVDALLDGRG